ncbi:auxin-induced protein 22A-like [Lycium barbarum]|uniref:auxin-induced protein 22A-like n=1 Tax=Lycium barbarum TaxID=112863 RepID=UPI00293F5691|nr:auxin-induced protein 22A-like [Lycium barbarum]
MAMELEITELRLDIPGEKRVFSEINNADGESSNNDNMKWPPVCAYRKKQNSFNGRESSKMFVKVSMDGAPFLRKLDLGTDKGYSELVVTLEQLFDYYGIGEALEDADNSEYVSIYEDKEPLKDGDWMLLGDVPAFPGSKMFSESCMRLRIKKRSDANVTGLRAKSFLNDMS